MSNNAGAAGSPIASLTSDDMACSMSTCLIFHTKFTDT